MATHNRVTIEVTDEDGEAHRHSADYLDIPNTPSRSRLIELVAKGMLYEHNWTPGSLEEYTVIVDTITTEVVSETILSGKGI